jgi:hypothetical protein
VGLGNWGDMGLGIGGKFKVQNSKFKIQNPKSKELTN